MFVWCIYYIGVVRPPSYHSHMFVWCIYYIGVVQMLGTTLLSLPYVCVVYILYRSGTTTLLSLPYVCVVYIFYRSGTDAGDHPPITPLCLWCIYYIGVVQMLGTTLLSLPYVCVVYILYRSGTDAGDHPPITPMRSATRDQVRDSDWRLYDFITRHFLATVSNMPMPDTILLFYFCGSLEFNIDAIICWSGVR